MGSPGIAGLSGKPGQVVRVQTNLKKKCKASFTKNGTRNVINVNGWCDISREKREVWDLLGHQVIEENLYVYNYGIQNQIRACHYMLCAIIMMYKINFSDFRA